MTASGPVLFARYAYPPNALGYCGPGDSRALLEYADAETTDGGLVELARRFEGAWPYLALIAGAAGRADPLDRAVVEAYWIGGTLLDAVPPRLLAASLEERFRPQLGSAADDLAAMAIRGGRPQHSFHVFAVYPWVGMLRAGYSLEPLRVLDSCRIRWGAVVDADLEYAVVRTRPLRWTGSELVLDPPRAERVRLREDGYGLACGVRRGALVSIHWDWICDVLTEAQATTLARSTMQDLALVNAVPQRIGPLCG